MLLYNFFDGYDLDLWIIAVHKVVFVNARSTRFVFHRCCRRL